MSKAEGFAHNITTAVAGTPTADLFSPERGGAAFSIKASKAGAVDTHQPTNASDWAASVGDGYAEARSTAAQFQAAGWSNASPHAQASTAR